MASVVRKEFDTTLPGILMQRSNLLSQEATILKYLAHQFNIPASTHSQVLHFEEVNIQAPANIVQHSYGNTARLVE